MSVPKRAAVQVFDPQQDYAVVERRLPHWSQAGTISFLTWRTWDSIPEPVLKEWIAERNAWLADHGINVAGSLREPISVREARSDSCRGATCLHWRAQLQKLEPALVHKFYTQFSNRWNDELDACHGSCVLRQPAPLRWRPL